MFKINSNEDISKIQFDPFLEEITLTFIDNKVSKISKLNNPEYKRLFNLYNLGYIPRNKDGNFVLILRVTKEQNISQ